MAGVVHEQDVGLNVGWLPHTFARTALFTNRKGNEHTSIQTRGHPWGGEGGWMEPVRSRGTGAPCILYTAVSAPVHPQICRYDRCVDASWLCLITVRLIRSEPKSTVNGQERPPAPQIKRLLSIKIHSRVTQDAPAAPPVVTLLRVSFPGSPESCSVSMDGDLGAEEGLA